MTEGGDAARRRTPFRLGDLEVFPDRGEIVRDGKAVRVEPLSMKLLLLLTERYPETVTRDEIIAGLWGRRVVTDAAISRQVAKLRRALDERPADGAFVQTVPKVGLRLKRPAEPLAPGRESGRVGRTRSRLFAITAAVVLVLAGISGIVFWRALANPPIPTETPLTASPLPERDPSLSHNGAWVAYAGVSPAGNDRVRSELVIRSLADDSVTRLRVGPGIVRHPVWSPSDDALAYIKLGPGGCRIQVASFPALIVRDAGACFEVIDGGLAWGSGNRLILSESTGPTNPYRLVEIDLIRGVRRTLTDPPASIGGDLRPVAGKAGELYFIRRRALESTSLMRMDLQTGRTRTLLESHKGIWSVAPLPRGELLIAGVGPDGGEALWKFRPGASDLEQLTPPGRYWRVTTSDAGQAVFERPAYRISLWSWSGGGAEPRRVTGTTQADWSPALSPDGSEIAFLSTRGGPNHQIWTVPRTGGEPVRLTRFSQPIMGEVAWRPDGAALAVSVLEPRGFDLFEVERQSGRSRRLAMDDGDEIQPSFSPGGETLYFVRRKATRSDLVARNMANRREDVLLTNVAVARAMPDGRMLIKPLNRPGLLIMDSNKRLERVPQPDLVFSARNWALGGETLNVVVPGRGIVRRPLMAGAPQAELPMRLARVVQWSAIDADRSGVVFSRSDDFDIDLYRLDLSGRR